MTSKEKVVLNEFKNAQRCIEYPRIVFSRGIIRNYNRNNKVLERLSCHLVHFPNPPSISHYNYTPWYVADSQKWFVLYKNRILSINPTGDSRETNIDKGIVHWHDVLPSEEDDADL